MNAKFVLNARVMAVALPAFLMCANLHAAEKAFSSQYPNKPLRLVVPYAPGGNSDFIGREIARRMSQSLNVQVVVDNRAGAGSLLGIGLIASAAPDGYSLILATSAGLAISPALGVKMSFDPDKSFSPISLIAYTPFALVVNSGLPVATVGELIALAKRRPRSISYGSPGFGTPNHLGGEMLKSMAGMDIVHVPYKGASPALLDVMTGEIQMMFAGVPQAIQQAKNGKIKIIAVGHSSRLQALPDIPAISELLPGFDNSSWQGVLAPSGTSKSIISRLNALFNEMLESKDLVQRFVTVGVEPSSGKSPEWFSSMIRDERARWKKVITDSKIKIENIR